MKNNTINDLKKIIDICEKYELHTINERNKKLIDDVNEHTLKIMFVGAFSSGKSALINKFLGKELLVENQTPETAIASEIVYNNKEYIEAFSKSGKDIFGINDSEIISPEKYEYLRWHIDSQNLTKISDTVIIDMPGFNSMIVNHNKAILRYAGNGNAYILVIDSDDGTIKQNNRDFINEIRNYDNNLAIAVSKSDLKTDEDMENICQNIANIASMMFGRNIPVFAVSKFDDSTADKVLSLINSFDKESIFSQRFYPDILMLVKSCKRSLETYKLTLPLDTTEYENEIKRHENTKNLLLQKLESEKSKLKDRFRSDVTERILNDVKNALLNSQNQLIVALKAGSNEFTSEVNNIIRPILVNATKTYSGNTFDEFAESLLSQANVNFDLNSAKAAIENIKAKGNALKSILENGENLNVVYKVITTVLAQVTGVIAPWLELIIIFLPEILNIFNKEREPRMLREKLVSEVIPQIISKLRPEVQSTVAELDKAMLSELEKEINESINIEIEAMQQAKARMDVATHENNAYINDIDEALASINALVEKYS